MKSAQHRDNIITDFKKPQDYELEIRAQGIPFLDKGVIHAIHQLHHLVPDKKLMLDVYDNNFDVEAYRKGADFVSFQE